MLCLFVYLLSFCLLVVSLCLLVVCLCLLVVFLCVHVVSLVYFCVCLCPCCLFVYLLCLFVYLLCLFVYLLSFCLLVVSLCLLVVFLFYLLCFFVSMLCLFVYLFCELFSVVVIFPSPLSSWNVDVFSVQTFSVSRKWVCVAGICALRSESQKKKRCRFLLFDWTTEKEDGDMRGRRAAPRLRALSQSSILTPTCTMRLSLMFKSLVFTVIYIFQQFPGQG